MARRLKSFQPDLPELDHAAVAQRRKPVFRLSPGSEVDCGANAVAEFQMPGDTVGMQMGQKHMLDLQMVFRRALEISFDVALRVNNSGRPCLLVCDEIRSMRQARQIELLEDHAAPPSLTESYFGCGTIRR